jgi:hypothetical protein
LSRLDGLRLGTALDEVVYHRDYIDMIGEKWFFVHSKTNSFQVIHGQIHDCAN